MPVNRKRKDRVQEDHTAMAFAISGTFSCATVAVLEDGFYSDRPFWSTGHFHEPSLLVGTVVFVGLLYLLQHMNNKTYALKYVKPYLPLLLFSGINMVLKLSVSWFVLIAIASVTWCVIQVRRIRDNKGTPHRTPVSK